MDQTSRLVTPCCIPLCRSLLLQTFVANACCRYTPQENLVGKAIVASQEILLQAYYVAERPPRHVTNPVSLTHIHMTSIYLAYAFQALKLFSLVEEHAHPEPEVVNPESEAPELSTLNPTS